MATLAIDTSTRTCVLGVRDANGRTVVDETDLGRTHSQEILPRIVALLEKAGVAKTDLSLIVYGQGPGSFTGLRIGIGVVQGLAYGLNVPVVGISSLACLALQKLLSSSQPGARAGVMVALAARNTEVYFGAYQQEGESVVLVGQEGVFEAAEIPSQDPQTRWFGVGDGWHLVTALTAASGVEVTEVQEDITIRASDLLDLGAHAAALGQQKSASQALPEYLRETVATPNP